MIKMIKPFEKKKLIFNYQVNQFAKSAKNHNG